MPSYYTLNKKLLNTVELKISTNNCFSPIGFFSVFNADLKNVLIIFLPLSPMYSSSLLLLSILLVLLLLLLSLEEEGVLCNLVSSPSILKVLILLVLSLLSIISLCLCSSYGRLANNKINPSSVSLFSDVSSSSVFCNILLLVFLLFVGLYFFPHVFKLHIILYIFIDYNTFVKLNR